MWSLVVNRLSVLKHQLPGLGSRTSVTCKPKWNRQVTLKFSWLSKYVSKQKILSWSFFLLPSIGFKFEAYARLPSPASYLLLRSMIRSWKMTGFIFLLSCIRINQSPNHSFDITIKIWLVSRYWILRYKYLIYIKILACIFFEKKYVRYVNDR